jgi:hypothetical protein
MAAIHSGAVSAAESGSVSLVPSVPMPGDLAGMEDGALLAIVRLSPRASEQRAAACELLVSRHQGLVRSCVRLYMYSAEPKEDLMQVGYVGLLKAIRNFDGCGSSEVRPPRKFSVTCSVMSGLPVSVRV